MVEITLEMVKTLREQTAVSIMQCKKALEEAEGDLEKAKIALTKKSGEIAAKKGDRELNAGIVLSSKGTIIEFGCETDFVANNDDFKAATKAIIDKMITENIDSESEEIITLLTEATQKFGERVGIVRSETLSGNIGSYIHSNNSVGAVVSFENEVSDELGKDVAMHIAAQNPRYLTTDDIDAAEKTKAEETLQEEVSDKPAEMQEKILAGKMNAYFKERVLSTQAFIKNPDMTMEKMVTEKGNKVVKFVRYGVGEE
jgi:elongation factor Ts